MSMNQWRTLSISAALLAAGAIAAMVNRNKFSAKHPAANAGLERWESEGGQVHHEPMHHEPMHHEPVHHEAKHASKKVPSLAK